jgi:hypothetical protein
MNKMLNAICSTTRILPKNDIGNYSSLWSSAGQEAKKGGNIKSHSIHSNGMLNIPDA